ncbi:MAG: ABC transporter permease [Lachnospiraceae bacterium]|nr:ABC transporter permease [Lachnospiraceae bacterium]
MSAFLYGVALQWKLDIRSKSLLISCYLVPLIFFALMGGIFTSVNPEMKDTLIQSMTIMGVSMGAFIGFPVSLVETYGSDVKNVYKVNGVPLFFGLISMFLSTFIHLLLMSVIILLAAPAAFGASLPQNLPLYFAALAVFTAVSLGVGSLLGLAVKSQAKLPLFAQLIFLPSIMLSGIMFPRDLLPEILAFIGKVFPATWGSQLMLNDGFRLQNLWYPLLLFIVSSTGCALLLSKLKKE